MAEEYVVTFSKEYIINFSSTVDINAIITMVSSEMSAHNTVSESCIQAATSTMISDELRDDIVKVALKEKESYNNWKTLYEALVNMEPYYRLEKSN